MPLPIKETGAILGMRVIKEEDILAYLSEYQKAISFYRWYPDILVDVYVKASGSECTFELQPIQRVILRALARHSDVNLTFSRGTSKSFINALWQIIKGILYPNIKGGVCASTLGQSGEILNEKVTEILELIPALRFELRGGKPIKEKDKITLKFKNNSLLNNLAAKESTRGGRRNSLTTEEIIACDPEKLETVVRPLLAVSRLAANGQRDPNDVQKRSEVIITTAGYKGSYAYSRLLHSLIKMVIQPDKSIVLGGSYRIPILSGIQDMEWIRDLKMSGDFNPASFPREFLSKWAAGSDKAYFPGDMFDKRRVLKEPIFEREANLPPTVDYYFGIDVGRFLDTTEIMVVKRVPHVATQSTKYLVYLMTLENMSFPEQAIEIKRLFKRFHPKKVVIDGAGVGAGLIDELVMSQIDAETGLYLEPWGVDPLTDESGRYNKFKTSDCIKDILYIIKANAPFNTQMYSNLQQQFLTGKVKFLESEREARLRIDGSRAKKFKDMTEEEKNNYILPFFLTTSLKTQMMNLESTNEGMNIIMKRTNTRIKKDKVSALGYILHFIKTELDDKESMRGAIGYNALLSLSGQSSGSQRKMPEFTLRGSGKYTFRGR